MVYNANIDVIYPNVVRYVKNYFPFKFEITSYFPFTYQDY
jgi:hypothetical protein